MFVPPAWSHLSWPHHILIPGIIITSYVLLYLGYVTQSSVTPLNQPQALRHYPYDHIIFHPGVFCRTCQFPKPARSKHCDICKVCVSKCDHHCVWLNNCVGRNNYVWFVTLLSSISFMLLYAFLLGWSILDAELQTHFAGPNNQHWSKATTTWSLYFHMWSIALASSVRVGAITLLSIMSFPLSSGLLVYHVYLIWAGMTTNESQKWADLRDDIYWGVVWKAKRADLLEDYPLGDPQMIEPRESEIDKGWKGDKSSLRDPRFGEGRNNGWWVVRLRSRKDMVRRWRPKQQKQATANGHFSSSSSSSPQSTTELLPPNADVSIAKQDGDRHLPPRRFEQSFIPPELEPGEPDERWQRVNNLREIDNIYDLGFLGNLRDMMFNRGD